MPKRKRNTYEDDGNRIQSMRRKDVSEKLLQSKKLLHRALKTAKGFERQKLGKRLKNAAEAGSDDEVSRINREIEALKTLDLDQMAEAQLHKSLLKVKAFAESPLLLEEVKRVPKVQGMGEGTEEERKALLNVTSGMWNLKPVKECVGRIMSAMYLALEIPAPVAKQKGRAQKETVKGIANSIVGVPRKDEEEDVVEDLLEGEDRVSAESSWEGFDSEDESEDSDEDSDEDGGVGLQGQDDDELDEETLSRYDALLGASSDEESFDESKYAIYAKKKSTETLNTAFTVPLSFTLHVAISVSL